MIDFSNKYSVHDIVCVTIYGNNQTILNDDMFWYGDMKTLVTFHLV